MQWDTCLWDVCGWLREFDCLWLQLRPEIEIVAGPLEGALRRVAGNLRLELDDLDLESDLGSEGEGEGVGGLELDGLDGGPVEWSHDKGARRVVRRADFGVARNLFGVLAGGSRSDSIGGVGTVGAVPTPGFGGAVQVGPVLPLTSRRASPGGGEGGALGRQWRTLIWVVLVPVGLCLHLSG